jgi:hypothetical protein
VLALASRRHVPFAHAAGVVAAISPGVRWEKNIPWAEELIAAWKLGDWRSVKIPTYSYRNVRKAIGILEGEPIVWPSGPKVTAFYRLLMSGGQSYEVCVDGHAANAALGQRHQLRSREARVPESEMKRIRLAYERLAGKLEVRPCALQATVWLTWKSENEGVPF